MDYCSAASPWFSGIEDQIFNDQCDIMDFFDENISAIFEHDSQDSSSPKGNSSVSNLIPRSPSTSTLSAVEPAPPLDLETPSKQHKNNNYSSTNFHNTPNLDQPSFSPAILTFGNPNMQEIVNPQQVTLGNLNAKDDAVSEFLTSHDPFINLDEGTKTVQTKTKKTCGRVRPPSQTYDHIIAERKRRQQLSQQFVALSAIVPGLKKMDKSSVLGDAIKYLKHLQGRVQTLEEQAAKQTMESVVLVKKSQVALLEDEGSSDEMNGDGGSSADEQPLPEFQAKLCHNTVLLRVHCEKHKGVLVKILSEIEKHKLTVTNASLALFGNLVLDITIIAEMKKGFDVTLRELLGNLRYVVQNVKKAA